MKEADHLRFETRILNCDEKRFHVHMEMLRDSDLAAVGEFIELHVRQKPSPHAAPIPDEILQRLQAATLPSGDAAELKHRSRSMTIARNSR